MAVTPNSTPMESLTKVQESPLCSFCEDFLPIEDEAHTTRPFHATAAELLHYGHCVLSKFITTQVGLDNSHQLSGNSYQDVRSVPMSVVARLREPQSSEDDVRWAILEIILRSLLMEGSFRITHTFSMVHHIVASTYKSCPQDSKVYDFNFV